MSEKKEYESLKFLEGIFKRFKNPLFAYSGGKDALAVVGLAIKINKNIKCICETSFYFPKSTESVKAVANNLGLDVVYKDSLTDDFVFKHPEVIFSSVPSVRSWSFAQRHQKTIRQYAKDNGHDVCIFGRRKGENCVPSELYNTAKTPTFQAFPVR